MDGAVLVIHDEQTLRAAARQALMQAGRQVAEANEVAAALTVAARVRPAVIVLPWLGRRPVRDALAQLREADATRRARLIVWAEQGDMPSAVAALEFGADDCLALPFEPFGCANIIQTVRSFGYRLVPPARETPAIAAANGRTATPL